jgi:dihydroorotate dehydrogenase subfamily 2
MITIMNESDFATGRRRVMLVLLPLTILGLIDSFILTEAHFSNRIIPCTTGFSLINCEAVLQSDYSVVLGVPLALLGFIHYTVLVLVVSLAFSTGKKFWRLWVVAQTAFGALTSIYLVYLQVFMIHYLCLYCMFSALVSMVLFFATWWKLDRERKELAVLAADVFYRYIAKPIFFRMDPEWVHESMTVTGELIGGIQPLKWTAQWLLSYPDSILKQRVAGIDFANPVGLAAGFDYEVKLTQVLSSLGFGFETVGTITNMPYGGNPRPRLGRLPKSLSLMVNKGFKSLGAAKLVNKMEGLDFEIPIGVSIGRTNSELLPTQEKSIADIVAAFAKFEESRVKHMYYELNISCPNIIHGSDISFYLPKNLNELLVEVEKLKIKRPIFVKMPISEDDKSVLAMLDVLAKYKSIKGVIFGNLQKDRSHPCLEAGEVAKFKVGNFSGKPTWERSNELIRLAYKKYGKKLVIIGCGGVFTAEDAYTKIKLGAALVQLITGMIYRGPQTLAGINLGLAELLRRDGYRNISEVIGVEY